MDERAGIKAAMDRLLEGTPLRSDGKLTIVSLTLSSRAIDVWWLEANTLPGLSRTGNLATAAAGAGMEYDKPVARILGTAETVGQYRP